MPSTFSFLGLYPTAWTRQLSKAQYLGRNPTHSKILCLSSIPSCCKMPLHHSGPTPPPDPLSPMMLVSADPSLGRSVNRAASPPSLLSWIAAKTSPTLLALFSNTHLPMPLAHPSCLWSRAIAAIGTPGTTVVSISQKRKATTAGLSASRTNRNTNSRSAPYLVI